MDILELIVENAEIILLITTLVFALLAKHFKDQRDEIQAAQTAFKDFAVSVMESLEDWAVTQPELDAMLQKYGEMKQAFINLYEAFLEDQEPDGIMQPLLPNSHTEESLAVAKGDLK